MVISGIYKIVINNKVYIGSAKDVNRRWREHKNLLNKDTHYNPYLQNAWNKYGENVVKFILIEELIPIKSLFESREQFWMDTYKSYLPKAGYNICTYAYTTLGRPAWNKGISQTERTKYLIRLANLGRKHTPDELEKMRIKNIRKPVSKVCLTCTNLFFGKRSVIKRRKYCSLSCAYVLRFSWNKGLTKKTSKKVLNSALKNSKTSKGCKRGPFSVSHRKNLSLALLGKNSGKSHIPSLKTREKMKTSSRKRTRNLLGHFIGR